MHPVVKKRKRPSSRETPQEYVGRVVESGNLLFGELRVKNVERAQTAFQRSLDEWSLTDWACALGGETGECLNVIKKMRRELDGPHKRKDARLASLRKMALEEIADIVIYADLLAARLGGNLAEEIRKKFNKVSRAKGSKLFL